MRTTRVKIPVWIGLKGNYMVGEVDSRHKQDNGFALEAVVRRGGVYFGQDFMEGHVVWIEADVPRPERKAVEAGVVHENEVTP